MQSNFLKARNDPEIELNISAAGIELEHGQGVFKKLANIRRFECPVHVSICLREIANGRYQFGHLSNFDMGRFKHPSLLFSARLLTRL